MIALSLLYLTFAATLVYYSIGDPVMEDFWWLVAFVFYLALCAIYIRLLTRERR